jgi:hypothetical protein
MGKFICNGYDVPNNSWDYADIVNYRFCRSKTNDSYVYDERRLSYFVECNTITREISIVSNAKT